MGLGDDNNEAVPWRIFFPLRRLRRRPDPCGFGHRQPFSSASPGRQSGSGPQRAGRDQNRHADQASGRSINENVSFDHYFATYPNAANPPGEPRFAPSPGTPKVNNLATANLLTTIRTIRQRPMAPMPPNPSGWIAPRPPRRTRTTPTPPSNRPMTAARPTCFPNTPARARRGCRRVRHQGPGDGVF